MVNRQYSFFTNNSVDQTNVSVNIVGSPFVAAFKIHEVTVPLAFNTTDSSNNSIVFSRAGNTKTATVTPGSYNAATMPGAIQTAMNNSSDVKDFVVTFNETSRKITIAAGSPFTIQNFAGGTTMYRQLGMNKYSTPQTGASITFGVADFPSSAPLLLTSTRLSSKHMVFAGEENVNVLCMVDIGSSPQLSVAKWVNHAGSYCDVGSEMPSVDFRLLNGATLKPVDLSQPFTVTMSILTDEDDSVVYS